MGDEIQELDHRVKIRSPVLDMMSFRCLLNIQGRVQVVSQLDMWSSGKGRGKVI